MTTRGSFAAHVALITGSNADQVTPADYAVSSRSPYEALRAEIDQPEAKSADLAGQFAFDDLEVCGCRFLGNSLVRLWGRLTKRSFARDGALVSAAAEADSANDKDRSEESCCPALGLAEFKSCYHIRRLLQMARCTG
jgi:hypothetical protein